MTSIDEWIASSLRINQRAAVAMVTRIADRVDADIMADLMLWRDIDRARVSSVAIGELSVVRF